MQEHDRVFTSYKAQDSKYSEYLASDEVKAASVVTDDQASGAKAV